MKDISTISLQEIRKDPLSFIKQINQGKKITVIYHSRPISTVISADVHNVQDQKSKKRMLEFADLARASSKKCINTHDHYKEVYAKDMAQKYGIS